MATIFFSCATSVFLCWVRLSHMCDSWFRLPFRLRSGHSCWYTEPLVLHGLGHGGLPISPLSKLYINIWTVSTHTPHMKSSHQISDPGPGVRLGPEGDKGCNVHYPDLNWDGVKHQLPASWTSWIFLLGDLSQFPIVIIINITDEDQVIWLNALVSSLSIKTCIEILGFDLKSLYGLISNQYSLFISLLYINVWWIMPQHLLFPQFHTYSLHYIIVWLITMVWQVTYMVFCSRLSR